jgi:hypothetical protein
MKFFRSYKKYEYTKGVVRKQRGRKQIFLFFSLFFLAAVIVLIFSTSLFNDAKNNRAAGKISKIAGLHIPDIPFLPFSQNPPSPTPGSSNGFSHQNIISTIFWVGESADSDNGYIANSASAWDENWQDHYGGIDAPGSRNNYQPASFQPKENYFYVALPYNDLDLHGKRKNSAGSCATFVPNRNDNYSWCKNVWVEIHKSGKVAYAQWEDVGPFNEDDFAYVFGGSSPLNKSGAKAGIDVSPAVASYLGLGDVDKVDWKIVQASEVVTGPWKTKVTESFGDSIN